jgi:hypothetical protein
MATGQPPAQELELRYGSASIFERADVRSKQLGQLAKDDSFTVLGTEGDFYQVVLPDGVVGFVYAANVVGSNLPLTDREQVAADERAATASQPAGGWRGMLGRLRRAR